MSENVVLCWTVRESINVISIVSTRFVATAPPGIVAQLIDAIVILDSPDHSSKDSFSHVLREKQRAPLGSRNAAERRAVARLHSSQVC